ncbi:MAG: two-component system response regulator [Acidobacteria bacterium]|nr:MAG: two-component system response regulator [Acidobacteriota bacterium]
MTDSDSCTKLKGVTTAGGPICADRSGVFRVLIVDDDVSARKLLAIMLEEAGVQCETAACAEEALGVLDARPPDAALVDLQMPSVSGMELLNKVRSLYPSLAFLMVTGVDDIRVGIEAMKKGADDYLVKPLQLEVVMASLERALSKKRLEQEVENYRTHLEEIVGQRTEQLNSAQLQIERSYEDTLEALGAAIDLRDSETAGHSKRVAIYAATIAKELRATEQELKTIARGAWLHDIGKLATPDAILLKPGPLTHEEWRIMRRHAETGYELVQRIPFLASAAEIVLSHHERWDGSGYPQGLKGADIPFGARIFAVADTLDAMTSDRPYRSALSFEEAQEEIRRGSGSRYDSNVVSAFLAKTIENWKAVRYSLNQSPVKG